MVRYKMLDEYFPKNAVVKFSVVVPMNRGEEIRCRAERQASTGWWDVWRDDGGPNTFGSSGPFTFDRLVKEYPSVLHFPVVNDVDAD